MSYRLKSGRPLTAELARVGGKQLGLAIEELKSIGDPKSNDTVHEARRHVKKVRALLRLAESSLGHDYETANERLRTVNRLLAPVADGEAVVDAFGRVARLYARALPRSTARVVRARLRARELALARQAGRANVLSRATALLAAEQQRATRWDFDTTGFAAVAPGLKHAYRRARKAMARATAAPTPDRYHVWRRRVKDLWLQLRLVNERCGRQFGADIRRLNALDGQLGELHNCAMLVEVLAVHAFVPHDETMRCVRVVDRYADRLRRTAHRIGARQFTETPADFARRVRRMWHAARKARKAAVGRKAAA